MARRKRKEEETDWVPPEFDDVAYMRQEMAGARAAVVTIAWAVLGAVVSFLLFSVNAFLAFFAGIAIGVGLYFLLPLLGFKTDAYKRRDWTGHGVTYFFSWLAVWIILLNPPFGDLTIPSIQGISVASYSGPPTDIGCFPLAGSSVTVRNVGANSSMYILFQATDNVGLSIPPVVEVAPIGPRFNATVAPISGLNPCAGHRQELLPAGAYNATFAVVSSATVTIIATDPSGHTARVVFSINTT